MRAELEGGGKAAGLVPLLAPNPGATGKQDRSDPTTKRSHTDSNLLHGNSP